MSAGWTNTLPFRSSIVSKIRFLLIAQKSGGMGDHVIIKHLTDCGVTRGKFTQNHDENQEISGDDIKKLTIAPGSTLLVTARGRQSAASGCEGILDLKTQGKVIGRLYFSSPWGLTYDNDFQVQNKMKGFYFEHSDINRGSGPLGSVTVDVFARKFLQWWRYQRMHTRRGWFDAIVFERTTVRMMLMMRMYTVFT